MEIQNFAPAVSIIIPVYNTEKYICECLNSILAQTFKNFEIIIVDDCSTDNSLEIAKSYLPKFLEGQLKIIKMNENTGGAAIPRNIGIKISRGEYLFFVDSDDVLTTSAIEEIYFAVKDFAPDILYCNRAYRFFSDSLQNSKIITRGHSKKVGWIKKPFEDFLRGAFEVLTWRYVFRREFILKNKIEFPNIRIGEDRFFNFFAMFFAEKVLRVPNAFYFYRRHRSSISSERVDSKELFARRTNSALTSEKILKNFIDSHADFFNQNPELKFAAFNKFVIGLTDPIVEKVLNKKIPVQEREKIILDILNKVEDKTALTAFLFNKMLELRVLCREKSAEIKTLKEKDKKIMQ